MEYDYIIAGAGLAGLSLTLALLESEQLKNASVLLIDENAKKDNDRTWSFWSKDIGPLSAIVAGSWDRAKVFTPKSEQFDLELQPYKYYTIQGLDYYRYAFQKIEAADNVTFHQEKIIDCFSDGRVQCASSTFKGKRIFKSYFTSKDLPKQTKHAFVWQHFKGWEIETPTDCFDPNELTLMDFRIADTVATKFFYVLPFAPNRALIEYTEFSKTLLQQCAYDLLLQQYIEQTLGIKQFKLVEEECNAIPMTDHPLAPQVDGKILTIGTMAGYVKPSSGYCFTRTLERNQRLVSMLENGGEVDHRQLESALKYQWYDAALLHMLDSKSLMGDQIFSSLFKWYRNDLVFKFLDEKSSFWEDIKIMSVVPGKAKFAHFLFHKTINTSFSQLKRLFFPV